MHLLGSRHTVLATRGIAPCPHGAHIPVREVAVDKTNKKMCSISNGKIKQGRQIGLCVYVHVFVLGCLLIGDKTQIFKSSQEKNGFLFLLVDYQARCNKHEELHMFRITNYELFKYIGSCNVVFSLDYFAPHLECQISLSCEEFLLESFINVCVQVKIIYLISYGYGG